MDPTAQLTGANQGITYEGKVQLLAFCVFEVRAAPGFLRVRGPCDVGAMMSFLPQGRPLLTHIAKMLAACWSEQ
eukprot:1157274-Pelagomonas_calceolata.AAC.4